MSLHLPDRAARARGERRLYGPRDFDLQLFGQAPSAELVTLGIGKETVYGTAVSPTVFLIPSSEGYDGTNELLERPGARKRIGQTEQLTGMFTGKGQMQVEVDPDTIGALLLLAFGAESIGADASNPDAEAVTTTLSVGVGVGNNWATPAAMTNIVKGQSLTIDSGETVVVRAITATQFFAYFTTAHASGVDVVNASVVLAYDHNFTLASPRHSFTAQLNDVISSKNSFGCKISKLSFKITPKAIIEAMVTVEYQGEANVSSPTSPSYSVLRGLVFTTPGNAVTMNGIAIDSSVQAITIDIDLGLITDYPKYGNGRYRAQLPETQTKVSLGLDLAFETDTMLQNFWGAPSSTGPQGDVVPAPIVVTVDSVDNVNTALPYSMTFTFPNAKPKTAPVTRKVGDYLKQTVQFENSESTNGAGDDCSVLLCNAASGASF
ncbi:MAG TPA: phage tail tube protein [Candidatus Cybelea sp.]